MAMTEHLRVLRLTENLIGFYDGRVAGQVLAPDPSWVDDGALSLGICSYALVVGDEALVYDTHVSVEHAAFIRETVERLGAKHITVVLSHWHLDHVAGTEAFADCEIVSNTLTAELLSRHGAAIEAGTHEGPPAISPLVLPTTTFEGRSRIELGGLSVDLLQFDIHSADATVLHLPSERLLLAGDTVEDTVTYVAEPDGLATHLSELARMDTLEFDRLYPNHGSRERIVGGGYGHGLIAATRQYVESLLRHAAEPSPTDADLRTFVAEPLEAGWITYFAPYERIHRSNLEVVSRIAGAATEEAR
jgi:cyclase